MLGGNTNTDKVTDRSDGNASNTSKRVLTYGRRRPMALGAVPRDAESVQTSDAVSRLAARPDGGRDKLLAEISERIKRLDILLPPPGGSAAKKVQALPATPRRSRKSEVRPPRQSIAPSKSEYETLLKACEQVEEMPFAEWLAATKWYQTLFELLSSTL